MQTEKTFHQKVIEIVQQIPYGKVTTYGAVAEYLGSKRSARMVGWVLNNQKHNLDIPAHRVVNRKGLLTGKFHFQGVNLMQNLLISEGIEVVDDQIVNLEKYLWNDFQLS
jgi:methylated-DNA-protein-cysteine methyltransferase-like protein